MIAAFLLLQAAAGIDGTPLGVLPRQDLPATGCAAYLWSNGETRQLVAMAGAAAGQLRLVIDGRVLDLARVDGEGAASFGLADRTRYRAGDTSATLDLSIRPASSLTQGAVVPAATLTLERAGQDGVAMPLAGLIGCAPA